MASNSIKELSARHEELREKHKEVGGTPTVPLEEYRATHAGSSKLKSTPAARSSG